MSSLSCSAVSGAVAASSTSAAAPATCGAAIEVPCSQSWVEPGTVDMIHSPGANTSTLWSPKLEKLAASSLWVEAPTHSTFGSGTSHG